MKKIFTIVIIALSTNAFSQSTQPISIFTNSTLYPFKNCQNYAINERVSASELSLKKYNVKPTVEESLLAFSINSISDSVSFWKWNLDTNGWEIVSKEINFIYNENNNLMSYVSQIWKDNTWVNSFQELYTYDANNNEKSFLRIKWNGVDWVNAFKNIYTYDDNNNIISFIAKSWNGSDWVNNSQYFATYDINNNNTVKFSQNWSNNTDSWLNSDQYIKTFDSHNNLIKYLHQVGNGSFWVNKDQELYTYDSNNNNINTYEQLWDGNAWVNSRQHICSFDSKNNLTINEQQYWSGNDWIIDWKVIYTYDAKNNIISLLMQKWDGSSWVNSELRLSAFNENNFFTSQTSQYWLNSSWINSWQTFLTYYPDNSFKTYSQKQWDNIGTTIISGDSVYSYSHLVETGISDLMKGSISLFPNPATNRITISKNSILSGVNTITIFSMNGQKMLQARFQNQKQFEMGVSTLSRGIYLVKIQSKTGIESKKLVIR